MSVSVIPNFTYLVPTNVDEALEMLDQYQDRCKIIAGGTDVIPKMKGGVWAPEYLLSLKKVQELKYVTYDEETGLHIGARMILRELEANPIIQEKYPALWEGMHSIANTQIRNSGTVVGNICNAVPSADTAPSLLALDAKIKIRSRKGERIVPIAEFFTGVCRTVVAPNELVTEIQIPAPAANSSCIYYKYSIRKALDLAMVGVAASVTVQDGVCKDVKIGLGAVAATPVRAKTAEGILLGKKLTDELINEAALAACEHDCSPITDMRATKEYRKEMVRILTRDAVKNCAAKA